MFNSSTNYETGNSTTVKNWIDSSNLNLDNKISLNGFIDQIATAPFFRYTPAAFAAWTGPEWLKQIWSTCALAWPEKIINIKLGSKSEEVEAWYQLYLGKCLTDIALLDIEQTLHDSGLNVFIIGEDVENPGAILLVDDTAPTIYRLQTEEISFFQRKKWPLQDALEVFYENYFLMIDDITAIRELADTGEINSLWSK